MDEALTINRNTVACSSSSMDNAPASGLARNLPVSIIAPVMDDALSIDRNTVVDSSSNMDEAAARRLA